MITQAKIADHIAEQRELLQADIDYANKYRSKIAELKVCEMYLQTNPSEEFIKSEITKLEGRLQKIDEGFTTWYRSCGITNKAKAQSAYNNDLNRDKVVQQIRMLKYILS